ncbi:MAG: amidohydrolase [Planctomycetes bacterium]|nr:amidohydrolase [Planctomycetota bacterium]
MHSPKVHTWMTRVPGMEPLMRDFLPRDLAPLLRGSMIDGCVAVQAASTLHETRWLLDLAGANDFILGVVGWADLCTPGFLDELATLPGRQRLKGLRHLVEDETDPQFLLRPDFVAGIAQLENAGLVYDLLVRADQLLAALELVARFPQQAFVLDHCGKPPVRRGSLEPWASQLRALAHHQNVSCKLSGLVTEADWLRWEERDIAPFVAVVIEAFGPQRLMLGSDWPVCTLAAPYGRVFHLLEPQLHQLSFSERVAIRGGTAARVYSI